MLTGLKALLCGFQTPAVEPVQRVETVVRSVRSAPDRAEGLIAVCNYIVECGSDILAKRVGPAEALAVKDMMEDLLSYLLVTFSAGPLSKNQIGSVFATLQKGGTYLRKGELEQLSEDIIPLAVMRELVFHRRVLLDPKRPSWKLFTERYGKSLMAS